MIQDIEQGKSVRDLIKVWIKQQQEYKQQPTTNQGSPFYYVAPIVFIDLIDRFVKELPELLNNVQNDKGSDTTDDAHSVAAGNPKTSCPYCGQYDSNCCPYPECDKPFSEPLNLLAEEVLNRHLDEALVEAEKTGHRKGFGEIAKLAMIEMYTKGQQSENKKL